MLRTGIVVVFAVAAARANGPGQFRQEGVLGTHVNGVLATVAFVGKEWVKNKRAENGAANKLIAGVINISELVTQQELGFGIQTPKSLDVSSMFDSVECIGQAGQNFSARSEAESSVLVIVKSV